MTNLIYASLVPYNISALFFSKLGAIAAKLDVNPNWLMQVMYAESRLKANALNPTSKAAGLIQFMPSTLRNMGYTTNQVLQMDSARQLDLVYQYFKPKAGALKSYYDVYAWVFFPAAIGKPDNWVLETKSLPASLIARQNPAVNINKDGKITVAEFKEYVRRTVAKQNHVFVFDEKKKLA